MICSRKEDIVNSKSTNKEFCSRVTPQHDLGVNPNKPKPRKEKKSKKEFFNFLGVLGALVNHRKWLDNFKKEIETAKQYEADRILNEELKRLRVKKQAEDVRKMIREGTGQPMPVFNPSEIPPESQQRIDVSKIKVEDHTQDQVEENQDMDQVVGAAPVPQSEKKRPKMKKKNLPAWAKTAEMHQEEEVEEDEELLNFMDSLDVEKYLEDVEFKTMLDTLKKRVSDLKGEPDWREKWQTRLKEKREKRKQEYLEEKEKNRIQRNDAADDDDNISVVGNRSVFSDAGRSIASSRTQGKGNKGLTG